jgi:hypothetical protein
VEKLDPVEGTGFSPYIITSKMNEGFSPWGKAFSKRTLSRVFHLPLLEDGKSRNSIKAALKGHGFSPRRFPGPVQRYRTSRESMLVAAAGVVGKWKELISFPPFP